MSNNDIESSGFDCLNCGLRFEHAPDRLYDDSEELKCSDCQSVNVVFIDEDDGAYLSYYVCRHSKRDDEACDLCEIEDGCGVGEVGT